MPSATHALRSSVRWLRELYDDLDRARTFGLAAQTAFWLFLSLMPLFAVAGLVGARFSAAHNWTELAPLLRTMPGSTQVLIRGELEKVARWRSGTVGIMSTITFVWLASTGIHAIFEAFEVQSNMPRSWLRRRLLAIGTCAGLAVVVRTLAILGLGLGRVSERIRIDFWTRLARFLLSFA